MYFGLIMIIINFNIGLLIYETEFEPFLLFGFPKDASSHPNMSFDISPLSEIGGMDSGQKRNSAEGHRLISKHDKSIGTPIDDDL